MSYLILWIFFNFFSPLNKFEANSNFNLNFEKEYGNLKIYMPEAIINIYEIEKGIKVSGEIKIYHRDEEKAKFFLKNVKINSQEDKNSLILYVNYSNDKMGREAKKLSKLFVLNVYIQKNLPLGIYLKKGEVNFKEKQERNIVLEGKNLEINGTLSKNYKKIELLNFYGSLNISGTNLIKRYLFPFGKKGIYLNPEGENESFFKIYKGKINIKIGD